MSRILLADDSPHAQRMGERILSEEGFEVVTVSDGDSALIRLTDVDPDLVLADIGMPNRSGYEVCEYVKISPHHRHTRVLLMAGAQETVDEAESRRVKADGVVKKPFEASVLVDTVRQLLKQAASDRLARKSTPKAPPDKATPGATVADGRPIIAVLDPAQIRAAVTVAIDASLANIIDEITEKVILALNSTSTRERE